jgi:hypothetical protein
MYYAAVRMAVASLQISFLTQAQTRGIVCKEKKKKKTRQVKPKEERKFQGNYVCTTYFPSVLGLSRYFH